jgi:hypothetical protein
MKLSITFNGTDITLDSPCDSIALLGDHAMACLSEGIPYSYTIRAVVNGVETVLNGDDTIDGEDSHNDAMCLLTSAALESEGY